MKPDIYQFVGYLPFLQEWFEWKKSVNSKYSYRIFAEEIGEVSPNYPHRVISGTRSLTKENVPAFAAAMNLTARETEQFELLVAYHQEKNPRHRTMLLKHILIGKSREGKGVIAEERLRFYETWYCPIIRELVTIGGVRSAASLGKLCIPQLTAREVREAINFLVEFQFVEKTESGFRQLSPTITTGDEITSMIVREYHADNLKVTAELIHDIPPEQREVSSLTFSVSEQTFTKMKEEIRLFRKRIIAMVQEDHSPQRVYQASFQLLPRTTIMEDSDA